MPKQSPPSPDLSVLKKAIDATRSALTIADVRAPDMPIVYYNKAFLDLTGYSDSEVINRNCRFLQGKDTDPAEVQRIRDAIKKQESVQVTLLNYKKDGTPFWNELIMSPVFDEKHTLTHYTGLQLDLTNRIENEAALKASQEELRKSNQELEQFTYAASHDLQEPLRMVVSFLGIIDNRYKDKLGKDGERFIGFAVDGAQRMQVLVNDLLNLSRIRTKGVVLKQIDLNDAYHNSLKNLTVTIAESNAIISLNKPLPEVHGDTTQLTMLFQNLISNAIKYQSKDNTPLITISHTLDGEFCTIKIEDNGIGIDEQYFDRIFLVFQRLHTREEFPGTGIGLALCRKIIEQHGGEISVSSTVGTGSTFRFRLKRKE